MATRTAGPTAELSATGARVPPSAGGDSAAGKATLKARRAKLADLVKSWYDFVRENDGEYFDKELWDRKNKNWKPVWEKFCAITENKAFTGCTAEKLQDHIAAIRKVCAGEKYSWNEVQRVFTQVLATAVRDKNKSQGPRKEGSPAASPPGTPPLVDGTNERAQSAAGDHGAGPQTTSTGSTDSPGADPKTGGGTAAPNQDAQVTHDTRPPAESAAGDHGAEPQTTSTGSTDSPGADPKTGGGTAAPNQDAQVTHDTQPPAESAATEPGPTVGDNGWRESMRLRGCKRVEFLLSNLKGDSWEDAAQLLRAVAIRDYIFCDEPDAFYNVTRCQDFLQSKWDGVKVKPQHQAGIRYVLGGDMTLYREGGKNKELTGPDACYALVRKAARRSLHTTVGEPEDLPLLQLLRKAFNTTGQGLMRLQVAVDGMCVDVDKLPEIVLPFGTDGLLAHRRNGPVEVDCGDYGPRDCVLVALNNAFGHVCLTREQLGDIEARFATGDLPLDQLQSIVSNRKRTPFVIAKSNELSGSFDAFLLPHGVFVIALVLIDKRGNVNSHAVTLDCERNYINFGYGEDSDGQIVLRFAGPPGKGDRQDVATVKLVMVEYFKNLRNIIVADVMQVFVRAKALRYAPGATYKIEGRKSLNMEVGPNKRARSDHNSNDPSLGPALGSGACRSPFAHSDPAVLAAIAAIEDPDVRRYAEQRCTEAALQRLLRENPAHAYFKDRLNELYDGSIDGRHAAAIGRSAQNIHNVMLATDTMRDNIRDVMAALDIYNGHIAQLHARVRALEEQLQQPVVQAEHVNNLG